MPPFDELDWMDCPWRQTEHKASNNLHRSAPWSLDGVCHRGLMCRSWTILTLPCDTPRCSSTVGTVESRMATARVRSLKYDSNHTSAVSPRPMRFCSTLRSLNDWPYIKCCGEVQYYKQNTLFLTLEVRISFFTLTNAVLEECPALYADWMLHTDSLRRYPPSDEQPQPSQWSSRWMEDSKQGGSCWDLKCKGPVSWHITILNNPHWLPSIYQVVFGKYAVKW